ncbi:hypothetical protein LLH00_14265, partial [bacterium]|nr:hypothetical protein [bacterium]
MHAESLRKLALFYLTLLLLAAAGTLQAADKVFIFTNASHTAQDFAVWAELAARLKPYGEVQVLASELSSKDRSTMPSFNSPWHEYACYVPAPWDYYPHPKIAPFVDAAWVEANRKLLADKCAILQRLGLFAEFEANDAHFLPEAFFQKYPQYRGPRVDHPRRSTREEFSLCLDQPDTKEMVVWMMAELKRNAPLIHSVDEGVNDAGQGLCWAEAQYPGPNGPAACSGLTAGQRVRALSEEVHRGAAQGGGDVLLLWNNVNLWRNELEVVRPLLPENTLLQRSDPSFMSIGSECRFSCYPIRGIVDPLTVIQRMERYHRPQTRFIEIGPSAIYSRGSDTPEATAKLLDIVEDCIKSPTGNLSERLERLKKFAAAWGGQANAETVFQALYDIHQALDLKNNLVGGYAQYSNLYCGVSMRHMTRPLVIKPDLLSAEEESYFLPYVFNPSPVEARMDYIDFHGGRMTGTVDWEAPGLHRALGMAGNAGRSLCALDGAPEARFLRNLGLAIQMWAHEVRSIHNFYHAQVLRDKYKEILSGPKRVPSKDDSWDGDPGNLEWNAIMRDELDNTTEMIA